MKDAKTKKKELEELKKKQKEEKLESLIGPLKDDAEFKEFLEANKAIKSKENIWKNDINLNISNNFDKEEENATAELNENKSVNKEKTKKDVNVVDKTTNNSTESQQELEKAETKNIEDEADFENGRLFVRNLCYSCKEEDLEELFKSYGPLVETTMPIDPFSKKPKGFAHITCMFPEKALKAFTELDGTVFQGRMLHILPGKTKLESDEKTEEMTFKKKKELELKKKAQSNHNWNSLFINQDSVANLMASKYDVDKSQLFDVHSVNKKSGSIAVKLAVGETQIVNDMRKFLIRNGVKLDAFNSTDVQRSKEVILMKNLPNNTNEKELREMFRKFEIEQNIKRLVVPDYGLAAIIEFNERQEARDAFKKLAYRKFKNVPIYLEWAPVDIFDGDKAEKEKLEQEEADEKKKLIDSKQLKQADTKKAEEPEDEADYEENATIFVKNLNFDTDEEGLEKMFSKIGKCKATVARKISTKQESLSMGYGFVKFQKAAHAKEALKTLQNYCLDGHNLELKFSNRTSTSNNNSSGKKPINKQNKTKSSKILVRNIPFEAKAKEIQELFHVFGELKYVRLPKKIDGAHRGFGFVDFVTVNDAEVNNIFTSIFFFKFN